MTDAYSPVPELNSLKEFDDGLGGEYFSDGFEFYEYGRKDSGLVAWLCLEGREAEVRDRLDRLIPFAQARGSGAFYALWRRDDRADLATLPVVCFGDEGELDVVDGLRDLFRLLAVDDEWFTCWDGEREADPDEEHSPGHEAYLAWLAEHFGLSAPSQAEADGILASGGAKYGAGFVDWLAEFGPPELDYDGWRAEFARG